VPLAGIVDDKILADLDLDVRDAARLAVQRDGVVGLVADGIGLVVACAQNATPTKVFEQQRCRPVIAIAQDSDVPGSGDTFEDRRKAVNGDEHGLGDGGSPVEDGGKPPVIGLEDCV
jgi:hypothetical protein